jgi:hypothetical protein
MTVKSGFFTSFKPLGIAVALMAASTFQGAKATEGGTSHYFPGVYNDFFMNMQLEPGFYFRDDLMYYGAQFPNGVTLGRNLSVKADLDMWLNTFKLAYISDFEVLGGRYGAALFLPVVFDANVAAQVEAGPFLRGRSFAIEGQDNRGGMADMVAVPLSLTWKWGDVNVNLSEAIFMPSGFYDEDEIVNLGRNYWSFDTIVGLTWLHPTRGHEISFNVGFMSNTENDATQYQSGDEFHMDYTVAQHFSEEFGIGVTGYYYNQLSNDESPLLDRLQTTIDRINARRSRINQALNQAGRSGISLLPEVSGFQGEAAGVGPIVRYSPKFGDRQVHFIGKWIHEFDVRNRFKGEIGMFSVALDF